MLHPSLLLPLQPATTTCPFARVHVLLWLGGVVTGLGLGATVNGLGACVIGSGPNVTTRDAQKMNPKRLLKRTARWTFVSHATNEQSRIGVWQVYLAFGMSTRGSQR